MHYIPCYQYLIIKINPRNQAKKGLISYYQTNGINFLKKHVDTKHILIAKRFEEVNSVFESN
jgi:hypothetical protein